ncbi:glycosyl transferase group 1 [Chloroherpeton thalassium ATCC 35110]|uniref:Glycosyl transferase group 1 n=1 Tax=Chloroherpeton thalassium (strain ATCC 35110 / GB-78) TaxID=517418 RepID=B3QXL3_CHLT3|nr:glycosyltransferase [Chloroherpeton thalassium]ACF14928.1 glycosyl transferase group 1 [Chloroherpeton thalassium ATCC 35110]
MNFLFLNSARAWGGNEKWSLMAATSLRKNGHHVALAYRKPVIGERFDLPKHRLPFIGEIDFYTISQLVSIIRKERIEILIPTKRKDYVLAGLACKLTGAKNILRLGIVRDLKNGAYNNWVYNKMADGIIVNAREIKEVLLKSSYMKADKIKVIYNGLEIDAILKKSSESKFEKKFPFTVSAMGFVTNRKGFDFLIQGFAAFLKRSNAADAGLVIIGDGPKMEEYKALARELGVAEKVHFTGFLENPYPVLAQSDVFAMTSKNEGFANALLEGIAMACAAITTPAGGVTEILKHEQDVLIVDYNNIAGLSNAIFSLYQQPEYRRRLAQNAKAKVENAFSLERMTSEMATFCNDVKEGR